MRTIFERQLTTEEQLMHSFLERAIDEFSTNPDAPTIMRRLALEQADLFFVAAIRIVRGAPDCTGRRYLTMLLLNDANVVARVTNRRDFSRLDCALMFQRLMEMDPLIDIRMARQLPGRYGEQRALDLQSSAQMLDILDQISPGRRLIPIIGYLTKHPDSEIAAKATLLVARRIQNSQWIRNHMAVKNPRIRANVVEGLWGAKLPYAATTYEECLRDENNRVVGNALFGLHLLGETKVTPKIVLMARDRRPPFRWTAAWVMGQVASPDYVEPLQRLVRDDWAGVRSAALRSLFSIKRATTAEKAEPVAPRETVPAPETTSLPEAKGWHCPGLRLDGQAYRYRT
jgi:hypothetical protein